MDGMIIDPYGNDVITEDIFPAAPEKKVTIPENAHSTTCHRCKRLTKEIDGFTGKLYYCPVCEPA